MGIRRLLGPILRTDFLPYGYLAPLKYKPLQQTGEVRLLQIEPGTGSEDLCGRLLYTALKDLPRYNALSYTWGSGPRTKHILCDQCKLPVTENLHEAMRRFRQSDARMTIWIDQVCINQEDVQERNSQIPLIGSIYRQAEKVLIWLGEDAQNSDTGIRLARHVLAVIDKNPGISIEVGNLESLGLPKWNHKDWQALGAILLRGWFTRVWVIQEAAMSTQATIICGKNEISWRDLVRLVSYVHFGPHMRTFGGQETPITQHVQRILDIDRIRTRRIQGIRQNFSDLLSNMFNFRSCEATDPRDKVYAFLGMGQYSMKLNYASPVEEVFREATVVLLNRMLAPPIGEGIRDKVNWRFGMGILYSAGIAYQERDLPSWIPDWSIDFDTRPLWKAWRVGYKAGDGGSGNIKLLAGDRLLLTGKIFDIIKTCGAALDHRRPQGSRSLHDAMAAWLFEAKSLMSGLSDRYVDEQSLTEVFKRTLMADRVATSTGYRPATIDDVGTYYRAFNYLYNLRMSQYEGYLLPEASGSS